MLWMLVALLIVFWLLGLITNVVGSLIHLLLLLALFLIVINLLQGRRAP